MQRIVREQARKYAFDWRDEPLLRVRPGEIFEIETWDASTGYFKTPQDMAIPGRRPGFDRSPPLANPIAGPVYLEGAERGDTLVVTIEDIMVDDYSWIAIGPRRGPLGESTRWPELSGRLHDEDLPPHARPQRHHARRHAALQRADLLADHAVHRHARRRPGPRGDDQPRRPGRMGRQPRHPRRGSRQPHPAADLSTPAPCSTWATSTPARATPSSPAPPPKRKRPCALNLDLIKGKRIPWLRIEKPQSIVSVYANRPLEVAVETATINLMDWLVSDYGFTPTDAYCLVSTCPDFRINVYQMCKIGKLSFVAGAEIPKRYLGG